MLLSWIIDEKEERDVAVINIPNALIKTQTEHKKDTAIINIHGILVDILSDISPYVYGLYVTTDRKGIKQLITQCMNYICGTMLASLLYYCKFCKTLKLNKFKMIPYDPCATNWLVNGLKQSIIFYVDDCKLSHKDPKVNKKFFGVPHDEYQSIFKDRSGTMQVNYGKVHK